MTIQKEKTETEEDQNMKTKTENEDESINEGRSGNNADESQCCFELG